MALFFLSAPAAAQRKRQEAPPEAIELYRSGREHYEAGRYREAIVDLKAALELDPESPNLIYNVARVSELLGNLDEAIAYYSRYLELLPRTEKEERDRIRSALRRLEGARRDVISLAVKEERGLKAPVPPSVIKRRGKADALFWISASTGLAILATGTIMGVMALDRQDQVNGFVLTPNNGLQDRDRLISEAENFALVADVAFGVGAGVVIGSALLFFLRETTIESEEEGTELDLFIDEQSATVLLKGNL